MLRIFALGSIAIVILFNNLFGFSATRSAQLKAKHPAPGTLIDVGGYRLHVYCEGEGTPTVIMEAGLGNPGLAWSFVQPEVAKDTHVCVYDRGGLGWSDSSSRERSANVIVDELHTLLRKANIESPYVLVGHSFGGLVMRLYAHTYPEEVFGLVLVDSYHFTQMEKYPQVTGKGNALIPLSLHLLNLWIASGIPAMKPSLLPALDLDKLPADMLETYQDLLAAEPKFAREAQAELAELEASSQQEKQAKIQSLGNIPLIVLSHGYLEARPLDPIGEENHEEYETFWRTDQAVLASLSPQGRLIIATESGHYIHLDEPEVVIEAIEEVLMEAKSSYVN